MSQTRSGPGTHYFTIAFIGGGAFGLVQYCMMLIRESVDQTAWNGALYGSILHPFVFGIVTMVLAGKRLGNPALNAVALLLVPTLFTLSGVLGTMPGGIQTPALLLSFGVSLLVFVVRSSSPQSKISA